MGFITDAFEKATAALDDAAKASAHTVATALDEVITAHLGPVSLESAETMLDAILQDARKQSAPPEMPQAADAAEGHSIGVAAPEYSGIDPRLQPGAEHPTLSLQALASTTNEEEDTREKAAQSITTPTANNNNTAETDTTAAPREQSATTNKPMTPPPSDDPPKRRMGELSPYQRMLRDELDKLPGGEPLTQSRWAAAGAMSVSTTTARQPITTAFGQARYLGPPQGQASFSNPLQTPEPGHRRASKSCTHCHKEGHDRESCFASHPERLQQYKANRGRGGKGGR